MGFPVSWAFRKLSIADCCIGVKLPEEEGAAGLLLVVALICFTVGGGGADALALAQLLLLPFVVRLFVLEEMEVMSLSSNECSLVSTVYLLTMACLPINMEDAVEFAHLDDVDAMFASGWTSSSPLALMLICVGVSNERGGGGVVVVVADLIGTAPAVAAGAPPTADDGMPTTPLLLAMPLAKLSRGEEERDDRDGTAAVNCCWLSSSSSANANEIGDGEDTAAFLAAIFCILLIVFLINCV